MIVQKGILILYFYNYSIHNNMKNIFIHRKVYYFPAINFSKRICETKVNLKGIKNWMNSFEILNLIRKKRRIDILIIVIETHYILDIWWLIKNNLLIKKKKGATDLYKLIFQKNSRLHYVILKIRNHNCITLKMST